MQTSHSSLLTTTVLIVDDEEDIDILTRQRFRREIQSGEYAFHFAQKSKNFCLDKHGGSYKINMSINNKN